MPDRYMVQEFASATGMNEDEIRFFEQVFHEFLVFSRSGPGRNEFSREHVDMLSRIRKLIHVRGRSIDEAKLELKGVPDRFDSPQNIFPSIEGNRKESAL